MDIKNQFDELARQPKHVILAQLAMVLVAFSGGYKVTEFLDKSSQPEGEVKTQNIKADESKIAQETKNLETYLEKFRNMNSFLTITNISINEFTENSRKYILNMTKANERSYYYSFKIGPITDARHKLDLETRLLNMRKDPRVVDVIIEYPVKPEDPEYFADVVKIAYVMKPKEKSQ